MELKVNGEAKKVSCPPLTTLLSYLRDDVGLTGTKIGCEHGGCGACTVMVDGRPRRSCLTAIATLDDGAELTTVEGLGRPGDLSGVQQAFVHYYAAQCGFCTPGMLVAATHYLQDGGSADTEQIAEALGGHMCRCTGYVRILNAVAAAANGEDFDLDQTAAGEFTTVMVGDQP